MILLVTNSRDFAVEPIVEQLRESSVGYLRLDLDLLRRDAIALDPVSATLRYRMEDENEIEVCSPRAILYRAPTHLRESSGHRYRPEELLARHQWAAFARSLMVFREATWINHPSQTYAAENKPFQLAAAVSVGLSVPDTQVANHLPNVLALRETVAVKALDTFLVRDGLEDLFFYTQRMKPEDLPPDACRDMPLILQQYIADKIDVRVTVVGDTCFVAETDSTVDGDWRRAGAKARFRLADAPANVLDGCRTLLRELGLVFGAIDLVRTVDDYTFLEVNPTGEWSWLDHLFDGGISEALGRALLNSNHNAPR